MLLMRKTVSVFSLLCLFNVLQVSISHRHHRAVQRTVREDWVLILLPLVPMIYDCNSWRMESSQISVYVCLCNPDIYVDMLHYRSPVGCPVLWFCNCWQVYTPYTVHEHNARMYLSELHTKKNRNCQYTLK